MTRAQSHVGLVVLISLMGAPIQSANANMLHTDEYHGSACQLDGPSLANYTIKYDVDGALVTLPGAAAADALLVCPGVVSVDTGDFEVKNVSFSVLATLPGSQTPLSPVCNMVMVSGNNAYTVVSQPTNTLYPIDRMYLQCSVHLTTASRSIVFKGYKAQMTYVDES